MNSPASSGRTPRLPQGFPSFRRQSSRPRSCRSLDASKRYAAFLEPIHAFDEHGHPLSIREMPEHVRRAIASYEVDPEKFVMKIRFVDKRGAIMDYSKLAGDIPKETCLSCLLISLGTISRS
jgi:hypothetical protein